MTSRIKNCTCVILIVLSLVLVALCQNDDNRLSDETYPIEYTIRVNTPVNSVAVFDGDVEITIGVKRITNEIILNAFLLRYNTIEVIEFNETGDIAIVVEEEIINKFLVLRLDRTLWPERKYLIKISFTSAFQSDTGTPRRGLFKSDFSDDGETLAMATNFAPQFASYVFPCYDEPTFTAKFTLSIQHPVGYHAIANMKVLEISTDDVTGMIITKFETTPEISIHSLAFAVSNFKSSCVEEDFTICVYHDAHHTASEVELVLQTTISTLVELKKYLGVSLDLSKLDIFPVYEYYTYYKSGSYGILLNNQQYFYFNEANSGQVHKEEIIRHTIRQVTSSYLGAMMAPEWWDDIWFSQGLSVLLEYMVADILHPEFDEMNQFLSALYEFGFIAKAVKPADSTALTPESMFYNGIEYKAAGILYMLMNIVGDDVFTNGLNAILSSDTHIINSKIVFNVFNNNAQLNSKIPDNYDLNVIMNTWLAQLRFPVVTASRAYYPPTDTSMRIRQADISNLSGENYRETNWWIPYTCLWQGSPGHLWASTSTARWLENIYLETVDHTFGMQLDVYSWMVCNKQQFGFYYMDYDPPNYRLLARQMFNNHKIIPALTRSQLLHVGFVTVRYQQNSFSLLFELCNYIHREETYTPINTFTTQFFDVVVAQVYGSAPYANITKFVAQRIGGAYDRVRPEQLNMKLTNLTFNDEKLREKIIDMACFSGYENCLEDMNELLKDSINNNEGIISLDTDELKRLILSYGMVLADENLFWKMVELLSQFDERAYEVALARVHDMKLLDDLLTILTTENSKTINGLEINLTAAQRANIFTHLIISNLAALDLTFDVMINKPTIVKELIGDYYVTLVAVLAESTKTQDRLQKFRKVVELYKTTRITFETELSQVERNVERCDNLVKEFQSTLSAILEYIDEDDDGGGAATMSISIVWLFLLIFGGQLFLTVL